MKAARSGDYYQANRTFRDLLKTCSDWGLVYLQLGVLELDTNPSPQEAIKLLTKATELLPTNPRAHFHLAAAHAATTDYNQALKHIAKAIELRPKYAQAHQKKAIFHEQNGQLEQAIATLENLLSFKRKHTAAMAELARLYELNGQAELSEAKYRALLDREPNVYFHWLSFGQFLRRQGKHIEARKAFKKADTLKPRPRRKLRPLLPSSDVR
uniref:FOG: TPR repeat n=1 Tax=uncultured myxobacterium HF0130_06F04 TaxID=723555 RepID=E7C2G4_9BACT|nr:FOG: TPR repeat [uncultured myxobacterium HF0130_06F04]